MQTLISIQHRLQDYFMENEQFTLSDAVRVVKEYKEVKEPSVRARIYEGIENGIFKRVSRGVYTVTKHLENGKDITCMLINGDGRDLSNIESNSIDGIITDHPYLDKKSHTGGNRSFATYECFQYTSEDFKEKFRVLKDGAFLVEFLPEENSNNYEYLFQIKSLAKENGFEYYSKVAWKKGSFVSNTGRKSKNSEDIMFFTKGKCRDLRHDAKKEKQCFMETNQEKDFFMSGANGMLPTVFDVPIVSKADRIHQAEKPEQLLREIIEFISNPEEVILDQFAGSGVLGVAAFNTKRNSILIEKDIESFENIKKRIQKKVS